MQDRDWIAAQAIGQNSDIITPKKGQPVSQLRDALQSSYDDMAALFNANPKLEYRSMLY